VTAFTYTTGIPNGGGPQNGEGYEWADGSVSFREFDVAANTWSQAVAQASKAQLAARYSGRTGYALSQPVAPVVGTVTLTPTGLNAALSVPVGASPASVIAYWGDGTNTTASGVTGTWAPAAHTYGVAGTYRPVVVATNAAGGSSAVGSVAVA